MKIIEFILIGYLLVCVLICVAFALLLVSGKIDEWKRQYEEEKRRCPRCFVIRPTKFLD